MVYHWTFLQSILSLLDERHINISIVLPEQKLKYFQTLEMYDQPLGSTAREFL